MPHFLQRRAVQDNDVACIEDDGMIGDDVEHVFRRHPQFLESRGKRARHDNPFAFRSRLRLFAQEALDRGVRVERGQGRAELAKTGFERMHVTIDESRQHGPAVQVDHFCIRRSRCDSGLVGADGEHPSSADHDRVRDRERRINGHDLAVVQDHVGISRNQRGGEQKRGDESS